MTPPSQKDQKLLTLARKRYQVAYEAFTETRQNQREDQKFYGGSPDNRWQWPDEVLKKRDGFNGQFAAEPCLTINVLPAHVHQVTNAQRLNRPKPRVIPSDGRASPKVADFLTSVLRHIDYVSNATTAYDQACLDQVVRGEGFVRIVNEYTTPNSFDQEPRLKMIRNPDSVLLDPNAQSPYGEDANYGFIETLMDRDEYTEQYGEMDPLVEAGAFTNTMVTVANWASNNTVRVCEYFYVETKSVKVYLFEQGLTLYADDPAVKILMESGLQPLNERQTIKRTVHWVKTNGYRVLERNIWPGSYIPIVRIPGNFLEVDGKLHFAGIVRNAKDAQRELNYWRSQEAAMLALQPRAPFMIYAGQTEGYEDKWNTANIYPWPTLEVNPDVTDARGNPLPLPQRANPPQASSGFAQATAQAMSNIQMTTGQYAASLGAPSNDRTGRAVMAREQQANTGTYHYMSHYSGAVQIVCKQLVELIPLLIDRERFMRIVGETGEISTANVNPAQAEAYREDVDDAGQVLDRIYNPTVGEYDVIVTTGPDYLTNRQESAEAMRELVQTNPALWEIFGDLMVEGFDWPNASKIAERLKRRMDPNLIRAEEQDIPPGEAALMQQLEQMQQMMQQMQQAMQAQAEGMEARELSIKEFDSGTKRLKVMLDDISQQRAQAVADATAVIALQQPQPNGAANVG